MEPPKNFHSISEQALNFITQLLHVAKKKPHDLDLSLRRQSIGQIFFQIIDFPRVRGMNESLVCLQVDAPTHIFERFGGVGTPFVPRIFSSFSISCCQGSLESLRQSGVAGWGNKECCMMENRIASNKQK